jgi:hypothetical protein
VQLRAAAQAYQVRIVWKGGALTDRDVPRFPPGGRATVTPLETIELVRTLAQEFDDAQIARILNRQGRRSGRGLAVLNRRRGAPRDVRRTNVGQAARCSGWLPTKAMIEGTFQKKLP